MNGPPLTNMRKLRLGLKMTQEAFAKSLGVSKTTYNNYETGTREPGHKFIVAVALKYEVTTDYLLGLTNERTPASFEIDPDNLSEQETKIALAYRQATDKEKEVVQTLLKDYLESGQEKTASAG